MEFKRPVVYKVYITRREHWSDKKDYNAISLKEWIEYVKRDHQMELINEVKIPLSKFSKQSDIIFRSEGLSLWKIHAHKGVAILDTFFDYERGYIEVCDPVKKL